MNAATFPVEITGLTVYTDASGAPATVQVADYVFACDTIKGETRMTCIKPGHGSRRESKVAASRAAKAYAEAVKARVAADWLAANRKMYE